MTRFTPSQLRRMAESCVEDARAYAGHGLSEQQNHDVTIAAMLRQAASDAEFRQFWESSGEEPTPAPRKPE